MTHRCLAVLTPFVLNGQPVDQLREWVAATDQALADAEEAMAARARRAVRAFLGSVLADVPRPGAPEPRTVHAEEAIARFRALRETGTVAEPSSEETAAEVARILDRLAADVADTDRADVLAAAAAVVGKRGGDRHSQLEELRIRVRAGQHRGQGPPGEPPDRRRLPAGPRSGSSETTLRGQLADVVAGHRTLDPALDAAAVAECDRVRTAEELAYVRRRGNRRHSRALGYRVDPEFTTHVGDGERLRLVRDDWTEHAVGVVLDGEELRTSVLGTAARDGDDAVRVDTEREEEWCAAFDVFRAELAGAGLEVEVTHLTHPGERPVPVAATRPQASPRQGRRASPGRPAMTAEPLGTAELPAFVRELSSTLAVHSHYVLHGNVRDRYLVRRADSTPGNRQLVLLSLRELLWEALHPSGFEALVTFDPVDGLVAFPVAGEPGRQAHDAARRVVGSDVGSGRVPSLDRLRTHLAAVSGNRETRAVFVVDYGSRLTVDPTRLERTEHDFFVSCEKLSRDAVPVRGNAARPSPLYNPMIWLVEREQDLPGLAHREQRADPASSALPRPDFGERQETARLLARPMGVVDLAADPAAAEACQRFAEQSDGLTLQEMIEVTRLAKDRGLQLGRPARRRAHVQAGRPRQPVAARLPAAADRRRRAAVADRVVGQPQAVVEDPRHPQARGAGPVRRAGRRVVAPARAACCSSPGPTGVGKTELAKTLAQLVFGDERAYLRFDMSEFAAEHAGDRLIGAPPGYVGYEAGGELTNAVRAASRSGSCCSTRSRRRTRASSTSSCRSSRTAG